MALYAFDGTWNEDEDAPDQDTNVVAFRDIYNIQGPVEYREGVGTRFGALGRLMGGLFGIGGRSRIEEMYDALRENWQRGDETVDIIGFSRGAALAVHFANILGKTGLKLDKGDVVVPEIRFLGVWDIVGSFGIPINVIINFQDIDLGWSIDSVPANVRHFYHALALNERRQTFVPTRPKPEGDPVAFEELWFKGVHSDVGGGNGNRLRSNIALAWMLKKGADCGLPLLASEIERVKQKSHRLASISDNKDPVRGPMRPIEAGSRLHPTAEPQELEVGGDARFTVRAADQYNWSGVRLEKGRTYRFDIDAQQRWQDDEISCGPSGWTSDQLPWYKEHIVRAFEDKRRVPDANWFELIGSLDDDDDFFRIGAGGADGLYTATRDAELYAFANDLKTRYDNNEGQLEVKITRTG
jgi:uncharacterized protein (DUF2235 family)